MHFVSDLVGGAFQQILRWERVGDEIAVLGAIVATKNQSNQRAGIVAKTALLSVSYLALAVAGAIEVRAQALPPAQQAPENRPDVPSSTPAAPAEQAPSTQPQATPSTPAPPATEPEDPLPPVSVYPPRQKPQSKTSKSLTTSRWNAHWKLNW